MKGKVLPVTESADEMFASKMLGDGIAVEAADGTVYAPCDGTVSLLFPTNMQLVQILPMAWNYSFT